MSFLKKLGETVLDTASTIGSKSADLVETGKLKLQRSQLESSVKEKKTAIGDLVYDAHKNNRELVIEDLEPYFAEIRDLENQIEAVDEKLRKEYSQHQRQDSSSLSSSVPQEDNSEAFAYCTQCGQKLPATAKFCNRCGQPL